MPGFKIDFASETTDHESKVSFNILDPTFSLPRLIFLEASAGTGKTFTLVHLVMRLLLENADLQLQHVLLVTFTRAAAAELKSRLRLALEALLKALSLQEISPPYLQMESKSPEEMALLRYKIQRTLATFDEVQVFTIHGFCLHSLQENFLESGLSLSQTEEVISDYWAETAIKDFLRSSLKSDDVSPLQLQKLLDHKQNQIDLLIKELCQLATRGFPIQGGKKAVEIKAVFAQKIGTFAEKFSLKEEKILQDFRSLALCFSKLCDRSKKIKPEVDEAFQQMAKTLVTSGDITEEWLFFSKENRLKKPLPDGLHYPFLIAELQEALIPLVEEFFDPFLIMGTVAEEARKYLQKLLEEEKIFFPEDLLSRMNRQLAIPAFAAQLRRHYRAVLIDEFQDTDPLQWRLFSSLFLDVSYTGFFGVVGDPKQAIYRFRDADLYTYLRAKEMFPVESQFSLDTNFRSHPHLIEALNALLTSVSGLFSLPQTGECLNCPSVHAGKELSEIKGDGKEALHLLFEKDEERLLESICQEILSLSQDEEFSLSECAILVKDRFQAERMKKALARYHLPALFQRQQSLVFSPAFHAFKEWLLAVLEPHDLKRIKTSLGSPLFAYALDTLKESGEKNRENFSRWNARLFSRGILSVCEEMIEEQGIYERLVRTPEGALFLDEFMQIAEHIAEEAIAPDLMLDYLMQKERMVDNETFLARPFEGHEGISLLTIHTSKGLEFPIVFALGVISPSPKKRQFVADFQKEVIRPPLLPLDDLESDAEKMRQFYVAVTRAKKRLYLPLLDDPHLPPPQGSASASHLFFHRALKEKSVEEFATSLPHISLSTASTASISSFSRPFKAINTLSPPAPYSLSFPHLLVHSYSSLSAHYPIVPREAGEKKESAFPSGPETGLLIHQILEEMPFAEIFSLDYSSFHEVIASGLSLTFLAPWAPKVSELLFQAFHTPLMPSKNSFKLSQVDPHKFLKESEFLFASEEHGGYLTGFIDLFFEHEGKYYLLDWKTNDLGDHPEDYSQEMLFKEMKRHHYDLQAKIYAHATRKYLTQCGHPHAFGGIFFIFLRGLPEGIVWIRGEDV